MHPSTTKPEPQAASRILPLVYRDLRRLAAKKLAHEAPGQTLDATGLVHEAYLRLVATGGQGSAGNGSAEKAKPGWDGRGHFFAAAAEAMRRILIERARRKGALKRGGRAQRLDLESIERVGNDATPELLALDEALVELEHHDPLAAQLVKLRYFAGLTHQEAAEALGITRRAADRLWALARAWLFQQVGRP